MITSITMKNVGSYKEETMLDLSKPITLIYGNNGAGKSLISNFLLKHQEPMYSECVINGLDDNDDILVYNQTFIEKNFYEDTQKCIFTLSEENAEINNQIEELTNTLNEKSKELIELSSKKSGYEGEQKQVKDKIYDKIYEFKQSYGNKDTSVFKEFFKGIFNKKEFCEYILKLKKDDKLTDTIENLEMQLKNLKQYSEVEEINNEKLDKLFQKILDIEKKSIFKEEILGSESSKISNFINKLGSFDWVERGYNEYLDKSEDSCPFCQQKINTEELKQTFKDYFNDDYKTSKEEINNYKNEYDSTTEQIRDCMKQIINNTYIKDINNEYLPQLEKLFNEMNNTLNMDLKKIDIKYNNMAIKVNFELSYDTTNNILLLIEEINKKISDYNEKIKNINEEKEKIKNKFFNICRNKYESDINSYNKQNNLLNNQIKEIHNDIEKCQGSIKDNKSDISKLRDKVINPFKSLEQINNILLNMGINDFKLKEVDNNFYKIIRNNNDNDNGVFRTLSEGEKMLISFLYFIETCKGIKDKNESIRPNRMIIIDDPISSLSNNHIFYVAYLIKHEIIEPISNNNKLVILTHNLYFFHEFFLNQSFKKGGYKLFRIYRNQNDNSCIECLDKDDFSNDYHALWKTLQDCICNKTNKIILPVTMRNILEYFSAFIKNDDYKKILNDKNFFSLNDSVFCRYINRNSHSDKYNIIYSKDIDVEHFMKCFEKIFNKWGYSEHYNAMMGIKGENK